MPVPSGLSQTSDNYARLQAAMADGGFSLPAGVFPVSRALVAPVACTLEGENSYRSVLKMTSSAQPAISMTDGARLTIKGVGLTGTGITGTAPGLQILRQANPSTFGLLLDDVVIQQFGGDGINAVEANLIVSSLRRVTCENLGGFGFNVTGVPGGAAGTSVAFTSCFATACAKSAYRLQKMNYSRFDACAADACGTGYVLEDCQGIGFTASGTEGIAATGTDMHSDGTSFRVDGCTGIDFGDACWTYGNSHLVLRVSGGSVNVRGHITENSPLPAAAGAVMVDSGSQYGG